MTYATIRTAFNMDLAAFPFSGDIIAEGTTYEPALGRGYLSSRLSGYTRQPQGVGADCVFRESGVFQVSAHRPSMEGLDRVSAIADALVAYYRRGRQLAPGTGLRLVIEYASAQPAISSGDWLTVPVVIAWFLNEP